MRFDRWAAAAPSGDPSWLVALQARAAARQAREEAQPEAALRTREEALTREVAPAAGRTKAAALQKVAALQAAALQKVAALRE